MTAQVISLVAPRACRRCGMPCDSAGHHCYACLDKAPPLPLSFVQSTIASAIIDMEKAPRGDRVAMAIFQMRQAFDAITPRIRSPQIGVIRFDGHFWAHPENSSECVGPFFSEEEAASELVRRIAGEIDHVGE